MASALPAKDVPARAMPETVAELDSAIAGQKDLLKKQLELQRGHQARCDKFLSDNDEASFVKEKFKEERAKLIIKTAEGEISQLEAARPGIVAREARAILESKRSALVDKIKKFQRDDLKKIEDAIAFLAEALPREMKLFDEIADFNGRAQASGLDRIESPEASRFAPGVPQRQNGTQKVLRSRLRNPASISDVQTVGGQSRYESYMADEPIIIPAIPEFKPAPFFLRVIVPSFHRDGPHYSPPGVLLPWYGK
jgi:hypothetical protein